MAAREDTGEQEDMAAREHRAAEESVVAYGALERRIGYALRRAQIAVFQDFYRAVAAHAISPAQYSVLTIMENNPGLSQTQVADALGIKKTNFVAMIKELEARGLALRTPMPHDRRSFALSLSAAGAALVARLHADSEAHEARIRRAIGEEAYGALFPALRGIVRALRADHGECSEHAGG
ncbi:MAG: MarR family transcriptional regulator [Hyphomicrobiales bacterium]|uniref:MarR family winged helix-turn-helix transcriptional regulator n=1 Tax=Rhabdaerophilum calidifontis TaxID=2604328 RepID=UPI00123B5BC1|nr:MarR family transcriptional regulator [Rhabdaerophilum calidifontis]MCA1952473.1 MarR family transcriptional regulator [Hyphomicrobiales bacterium]